MRPQSRMLLVIVGEGDPCQERLMLEGTFLGLVGICPEILFLEGGPCLGLLALEAISCIPRFGFCFLESLFALFFCYFQFMNSKEMLVIYPERLVFYCFNSGIQ